MKEVNDMKGCDAKSGWMGWTGTACQLFETEDEYVLWYREMIGD
jgi:hypothetical protein